MDMYLFTFFFNDTATTEIYTLSLHDALPISMRTRPPGGRLATSGSRFADGVASSSFSCASVQSMMRSFSTAPIGLPKRRSGRSEEHTSELQSRQYLVCRLLLEKKNTTTPTIQ